MFRAIALLAVLFAHTAAFAADPAQRILVLGFGSKLLSDIEDRIVREEVMRGLITRGHPVVPVMALEEYFLNRAGSIRAMDRAAVAGACRELSARIALSGAVTRMDGRVRVALSLYRADTGEMTDTAFTVDGAGEFKDYGPVLIAEILRHSERLLASRERK